MTQDERMNKIEDDVQKMREKVNHNFREANKVLEQLKSSIKSLEEAVGDIKKMTGTDKKEAFMSTLMENLKKKGSK